MATPYLDKTGFTYFVSKLKTALSGKANADAGVPKIAITSTDGVTYTGSAGLSSLTVGQTITVVPDKTSTSTAATLNIDSLGAKTMRQSTTYSSSTTLAPADASWLVANKPVTLQYDGTYWRTVNSRPNAADLSGTVKVTNGGTGQTTITPDVATSALRAISAGTTDLTAGTSELTTGAIYLVYEE